MNCAYLVLLVTNAPSAGLTSVVCCVQHESMVQWRDSLGLDTILDKPEHRQIALKKVCETKGCPVTPEVGIPHSLFMPL